MKFNDLKISTRLTLGFGLMALLIGLMGTLSVVLASRADKAFHSIIDDRFPKVLHLHVAKEDVTGVELALTQMLLDTSPENVQRHQATINAKRQTPTDHAAVRDPLTADHHAPGQSRTVRNPARTQ